MSHQTSSKKITRIKIKIKEIINRLLKDKKINSRIIKISTLILISLQVTNSNRINKDKIISM